MKKIKVRAFIFILILLSFLTQGFLVSDYAVAETILEMQEGFEDGGGEIPGIFGGGSGEPRDIRQIVVDILNVTFTFLGMLMVFLIIYSGYRWMTAGGNDEQVLEAKKYIRNAIIGIIIILASFGITAFIASSVAESTGADGVTYIINTVFNV